MALVNFTNLDFDQIKTSIKDYLRSNSNFTDYDFEGSNLSAIIDVLAYNTYISSYNANMVSNEVFIDSATLRENVVSLARNIGYVPKSRTSARATVSFFVDTTGFATNPLTLTLRRGVVCTSASNFGAESYTFSIPDDITAPVVNGIASFDGIEVYEGTYLTQTFIVDANNPNQRFILPNPNVDTKLLRVLVRNTEQSSITRKFTLADNLIGINSESKVFFIQEIEDQRYELIFGDNVFGKKLDNLNFIEVSYVVTNGEAGNNVSSFTFNGRVVDNNGIVVSSGLSLLTTDVNSQYGAEIESINSIKKYAPRIYASQNRAVTASDYEAIIPTLYPEAESISVFGGEELTPPRYGKVYISIKPYNGAFVPNTIKDNIIFNLRKYSVAGIVPEILDLKYLYVEFDSTVYYNSNTASSANALKTIISSNIEKYADSTELNKYGARFKYSKFLKIIDDSNQAITSNITKISMRRDGKISTNQLAKYEICFGNQFHIRDFKNGYNIKSSGFNVDGISDTVYLSDIPSSDGKLGRVFLFTLKSPTEPIIVRDNVGSVDYVKGEILLNPIIITKTNKFVSGVPTIETSAIPQSNDVIGLQDLYLQLDINNSVLNMVSDEISSGTNISGSNYTVTSSYTNGALVRL
jgi:hypothetical protein